ncbi:MAG TPA: tyrosine--tRNA ligase [Acidimicrobiales bacterium]|nr:tyrosine--tRNA ligase [Acidimicrobiales bacterium]
MPREPAAPTLSADLEFRGLVHQVTDPSLPPRLDAGGLTAYIGFDPTADSLHVGHLLQVFMLRRLQLAGHRPIVLAGGATGGIGDPGGKNEERTLLGTDELAANLAAMRSQLERLIDFGDGVPGARALLLDNGEWLNPLGLVAFLRDVGKHFSVNQMMAKESVRARLQRPDQGISYTEFSYMLLQAYDFLRLFDDHGCRLQLGASDQWGNITMGIELIRKARRQETYGLTTPLVVKGDGTKFGKTETDTVWLDAARTSPYQLYQFFFRTEDSVVGTYLRYLTFLDHDAIVALDADTAAHPERREAPRALAREVCTLVHGGDETARAEVAAGALYSGTLASLDEDMLLEVRTETPTTTRPRAALDGTGLSLVDALVDTGLATSKNQARTLVVQGGVSVNDRRVKDTDARIGRSDLLYDRYLVLRKGRDYHLLCFE